MTQNAPPPADPAQSSYHFHVMRRAIDVIDSHDGTTVSLEQLAAAMNMSPAHFQRLFSAWAGVSPKRLQQYLTLGHAKTMLRDHCTTLEAADNVGLSGSGRLHDLFIKWEAMSPGEFARQGEGTTIYWGHFDTPFGRALAMGTARGLCGLGFLSETNAQDGYDDLARRWPKASYVEDPARIANWVDAATGQTGTAELHLMGAPFQIKVWEALMSVPSGHVTTYSNIAAAIGRPKAVRAVGTAVGRNPVSWLIPCHRALRKTGALGGYHWGLPVKRALLAWESARADELRVG
ncbi:MAG: bifunctional helix-turn-helix domain-containing protein/methylated-DNA--[protein]-cysteine S-methyltransferase [Rhodobacteraceae bacterium]|nr:bifunctional helix-turn-helix domain-containing protein/methylated-DNA--[protein]-cysteine S-methyltransferase [Paracoccaceae bacterium]